MASPPSESVYREALSALGLAANNRGVCTGREWLSGEYRFASTDPATGEPIAEVEACTSEHYEAVMVEAARAWHAWRTVPAPQRGQVIRRIGDALRARK